MGAKKINPTFFDEAVGHAFIAAAIKTVEAYTGAKSAFNRKHQIAKSLNVEYEVSGIIHFKADGLDVQMMLAFKKEIILHVYEKMLSVVEPEINDDVQDCVGELTNVIYGYAKAPLVDEGHSFSMAQPKTVRNVNEQLINKKSLEIPFKINGFDRGFSLILSL